VARKSGCRQVAAAQSGYTDTREQAQAAMMPAQGAPASHALPTWKIWEAAGVKVLSKCLIFVGRSAEI